MSKIWNILKNNVLLLVLLVIFSFLFFFRMDWNTLVSWDEAWYGSIAREILKTGDWMKMMWNGKWYYDHPPMGFWLIAISYRLFGINEFTTRLPSVILGVLTILLVYLTSVQLFKNKVIGFVSGLIMGTTVWYFIRVRSGNLDSVFVFFYILAIFLSVKSSKNFKWFPLAMAAFGGLILSKTLVGFSAGILILFINLKQIFKLKNIIWLLLGIGAGALVAWPWYYIHIKTNPLFIQEHFLIIGTRNKSLASYFQLNAVLPLFYLHMGVRKWYYLWLLGLGMIGITLRFIKKNYFFLLLWNAIILYPFLTSDKTQIWHLIPVYLPMSLIIAGGIFGGGEIIYTTLVSLSKKFTKRQKKLNSIIKFAELKKKLIITIPYLAAFILLALVQIKGFYKEVYPGSKYIPDDVDISKRAAKYSQNLYLDDDFLPIAVFYSGKPITTIISLPDEKRSMVKFFKSDEKNFVMITRNWAIDNLVVENIPYKILEKNNSFSIVSR